LLNKITTLTRINQRLLIAINHERVLTFLQLTYPVDGSTGSSLPVSEVGNTARMAYVPVWRHTGSTLSYSVRSDRVLVNDPMNVVEVERSETLVHILIGTWRQKSCIRKEGISKGYYNSSNVKVMTEQRCITDLI